MKWFLCLALVVSSVSVTVGVEVSADEPLASRSEIALSMKNITVFARNAASALAEAQAKNPGWSVISVKKVSKDPKSMAYRVVLKKKQGGGSFSF